MTFGQIRLLLGLIFPAIYFVFPLHGFPSFEWGKPKVSILASKCERFWVDEARNDPALECYLTSQVDRLCRVSEKEHLLWFVSRYEKSKAAYERKLLGYLIGVKTGMKGPPSKDAKGGRENILKQYGRVATNEALKLKGDEQFVKAVKMRTLIDTDLTKLLRKLAAKGLINEQDFGWGTPEWVSAAFVEPFKVMAICPKPFA